ncbi:hypothetical protein JKV81_05475 [Streptomyces sp. For3]|uniref:hypothetical protein n=1 Tax=Streptomyces silvae TaxID=2803812 RepID=UPI0019212871|nr:hypothetical protein [Streptomyces silvae]MBL1286301.1 hypothetical protein [Streptomyces silvae]
MGAVICDVSFQPRCNYERTLRPRLLHLQLTWADARTIRGFQRRLVTEDLTVVMRFNHAQKVATAQPSPTFSLPTGSVPARTFTPGSIEPAQRVADTDLAGGVLQVMLGGWLSGGGCGAGSLRRRLVALSQKHGQNPLGLGSIRHAQLPARAAHTELEALHQTLSLETGQNGRHATRSQAR